MAQGDLNCLMTELTRHIGDRPLDETLQRDLNSRFPPGSEPFEQILAACQSGVEAGTLCVRESGGIKFGRVLKPAPATMSFSVDLVDMQDVVGPHHVHPNGEIDLIMPLTPGALFDGRGAGWVVYGPRSAHAPTVTNGRALVLYLLPDGKINFTQSE